MYGSGLRIMEAVRLRIQDVDFANNYIVVRESKGLKWRRTLLPSSILDALKAQINTSLAIHNQDLQEGFGHVYLPNALNRKHPRAASHPKWQYIFPADKRSKDPRSDVTRRHHVSDQQIQRQVRKAITTPKYERKRAAIHLDIASLQTYSPPEQIFAQYRSYWGMRSWPQLSSIHTSWPLTNVA